MGLILSRNVGQVICIGDDITVRIAGVKGSQVRLDVCAPKDVAVNRKELAERIHDQTGAVNGHPDRVKP